MMRSAPLVLLAILLGAAPAVAQDPSEAAQAMVGAWEISNAARDKTCGLTFSVEAAAGGFRLELDESCAAAFPSLKELVAWGMGPSNSVRLMDAKGAVLLDFSEVETNMYEAERKGEGLYFMRTQAAIKAATVSADQLFGEWALLQEIDKPLCKVTLSSTTAGEQTFRITVRPGCASPIVALGLATWRLDRDELLLIGRGATWRFLESDSRTWERIPPSTDPMVLMRQ
jgi:hypothetical protein